MKSKVLKLLCVMLVFVIFMGIMTVVNADETTPDNSIQLVVRFDRDNYIKGDTANAYIYIEGLGDETTAGDILQGYQAYISYDSAKLEFNEDDTYYCLDAEVQNAVAAANPVTGESVIATYLYSEQGISLEDEVAAWRGILYVMDLSFTVKADINTQIDVSFDTTTYEIEALTQNVEKSYNVTSAAGDTAIVVPGEGIVEYFEPEYDTNNYDEAKVWVEQPLVSVAREDGAVLIVKLYNNKTKRLEAPVIIKQLSSGFNNFTIDKGLLSKPGWDKIEFTIGADAAPGNLEVHYYIWDSLVGMRSIGKSGVCNVKSGVYPDYQF